MSIHRRIELHDGRLLLLLRPDGTVEWATEFEAWGATTAGQRLARAAADVLHATDERVRTRLIIAHTLLQRLEWIDDKDGGVCPVCSACELEGGHKDDCDLAAFLRDRDGSVGPRA